VELVRGELEMHVSSIRATDLSPLIQLRPLRRRCAATA